jgi:hypothetical protein
LIEGALNYWKEDFDLPVQARVPHYVTCFSVEKDDLSQWRAYGGGENGYAIGFRAADLWGCPNAILARINYDVSQHCGLAKQSARKMVELFIDGLRKCALVDVIEFGEQFLTEWEKAITLVAPVVKTQRSVTSANAE